MKVTIVWSVTDSQRTAIEELDAYYDMVIENYYHKHVHHLMRIARRLEETGEHDRAMDIFLKAVDRENSFRESMELAREIGRIRIMNGDASTEHVGYELGAQTYTEPTQSVTSSKPGTFAEYCQSYSEQ